MKKITKFLVLSVIALNLDAQEKPKNYLSLELDPAPFVLSGYSFSLKYSPAALSHIAVTASLYRSPMPDRLMGKENLQAGFTDLELKPSTALFADYFLRNDRSGFYFGPSVFLYSKAVNLGQERHTFSSLYSNLRVGYVYKPFKKYGLYFNPWLNAGKELFMKKSNHFGDVVYKAPALSCIMALHVGYQVEF